MVPFERALVGFYRSSIVTFPLSLRVSEILPLLFSSMPLCPYPTPNRGKIYYRGVPFGVDPYVGVCREPGPLEANQP